MEVGLTRLCWSECVTQKNPIEYRIHFVHQAKGRVIRSPEVEPLSLCFTPGYGCQKVVS